MEAALFSCICKMENKSFIEFSNINSSEKKYSYYTAAMQENYEQILESA